MMPPPIDPETQPSAEDQPETLRPDPESFPRRIPNVGHAALFVSISYLFLVLTEIILMALGKSPAIGKNGTVTVVYPKLQIAAQGAAYLLALLAAWFVFPMLWRRRFLDGLSWNATAARAQAYKLIPLGLLLGALVQVVTEFVTPPKSAPVNEFFASASDAWLMTVFGTVLAPLFEEICFRGFLVPAFAIAYDWLSLPRTPEAHRRWTMSVALTPASLIFSAVLSSLGFAALHGQQISFAPPILLVLFTVSLILTFVRVRTQSVAASTLVHSAYNLFVFVAVFLGTGGYRHLDRMGK